MIKKVILATALAAISSTLYAAAAKLPDPLLSGYTGMNFDRSAKELPHVEKMIANMGKAGFNSLDIKIQHKLHEVVFSPENIAKIQRIYDLTKANNMVLQIYLYPLPYDGRRREENPVLRDLPVPVDMQGNRIESAFLITEPKVWQTLFRHAPQWIELRKKIPFISLKFDIETITLPYSFDDKNWGGFCKLYPQFKPETKITERGKAIQEKKFIKQYQQYFQNEVEKAVKVWIAGLHKLDPDLMLGYMPARRDTWIAKVFERSLATDRAPAICDGWDMYNGQGYSDALKDHKREVKERHPNNIFVCWLRPNSYIPKDITISAYHAAGNIRGYSLWTLYMMDENLNKTKYRLPGKWHADDYFAAFAKANAAIAADVKAGTRGQGKRIPFEKSKPLVVPLEIKNLKTPEFLPLGDGSGKDKEFVMRNQSIVRLYAKAGEKLHITLRHAAGNKRPVSLQYALFDQNKNILVNEAVNPHGKSVISITAPHTGCYTFTVSGGRSQAWYGIKVHTKYYAFDTEDGMKFASFHNPQTFYLPGKDMGNKTVKIDMCNSRQSHTRRINDGEAKVSVRQPVTLEQLPDGIVKIAFSHGKVPGTYSQDFQISFPKGKTNLIYGQPQRGLVPVKK